MNARISQGGSYKTGISVSGKNGYYFSRNSDLLARGRAINFTDEDNMTQVCIISTDMVEEFFYGVDPIGENLYIGGIPFTVVGLMAEEGSSNISDLMSGSPDILIPYTTALKLNSANVVTSFTVYLAPGIDSETATDLLEAELDAMFSYEEDCYTIMNMSSIEDTMQNMLNMVSALLAGIASIALIVGGIGIMNMMLTTVTERTTEIGLKKALGAIPWQIQAQFLIESFLLSIIGGALGILLGLTLSLVLSRVMGTSFVISTFAIVLGAGFSAAVGIIFGWAPARKASRLNPIDALRSA
jgi:putative ABC transport system permease protein